MRYQHAARGRDALRLPRPLSDLRDSLPMSRPVGRKPPWKPGDQVGQSSYTFTPEQISKAFIPGGLLSLWQWVGDERAERELEDSAALDRAHANKSARVRPQVRYRCELGCGLLYAWNHPGGLVVWHPTFHLSACRAGWRRGANRTRAYACTPRESRQDERDTRTCITCGAQPRSSSPVSMCTSISIPSPLPKQWRRHCAPGRPKTSESACRLRTGPHASAKIGPVTDAAAVVRKSRTWQPGETRTRSPDNAKREVNDPYSGSAPLSEPG